LQVDVLRRFLLLTGMPVRHVMNITDVDDKIIRNAAAAGSHRRVHGAVRAAFFEDLDALRVQRPEQIARATEHIPRMVELMQKLAAAGAAYQTEDGAGTSGWRRFPSTAS
jgi:cysteinyl-tRNA synthetase